MFKVYAAIVFLCITTIAISIVIDIIFQRLNTITIKVNRLLQDNIEMKTQDKVLTQQLDELTTAVNDVQAQNAALIDAENTKNAALQTLIDQLNSDNNGTAFDLTPLIDTLTAVRDNDTAKIAELTASATPIIATDPGQVTPPVEQPPVESNPVDTTPETPENSDNTTETNTEQPPVDENQLPVE